MIGPHDPKSPNEPDRPALDRHLRQTFEAPDGVAERVARRALDGEKLQQSASFPWWRWAAVATTLVVVVAALLLFQLDREGAGGATASSEVPTPVPVSATPSSTRSLITITNHDGALRVEVPGGAATLVVLPAASAPSPLDTPSETRIPGGPTTS